MSTYLPNVRLGIKCTALRNTSTVTTRLQPQSLGILELSMENRLTSNTQRFTSTCLCFYLLSAGLKDDATISGSIFLSVFFFFWPVFDSLTCLPDLLCFPVLAFFHVADMP